jgi:hypothetical protein
MKKTMPESSYKEIKYQLDNKLVSSNQYWEIFEKALIEKDIKLLQDLIDYKHNTQSNVFIYCEDENIPRIIAAIPVDNIDYSINLFMKTGTSASRIMDEALAINADGNPDLISRKDAIIERVH